MACHGLLIALPAIREMRHRLAEEALIPPPFLTGKDVLALGVEAGPHVGVLLREVADMQLEERLTSRAEALAWLSERVKSAETP